MKRKLQWGTRRRIGTVIYIAMILAVDIFLVNTQRDSKSFYEGGIQQALV